MNENVVYHFFLNIHFLVPISNYLDFTLLPALEIIYLLLLNRLGNTPECRG